MPQAVVDTLHNSADVMQNMFSGLGGTNIGEWDKIWKQLSICPQYLQNSGWTV